jgi:hypothetical protein
MLKYLKNKAKSRHMKITMSVLALVLVGAMLVMLPTDARGEWFKIEDLDELGGSGIITATYHLNLDYKWNFEPAELAIYPERPVNYTFLASGKNSTGNATAEINATITVYDKNGNIIPDADADITAEWTEPPQGVKDSLLAALIQKGYLADVNDYDFTNIHKTAAYRDKAFSNKANDHLYLQILRFDANNITPQPKARATFLGIRVTLNSYDRKYAGATVKMTFAGLSTQSQALALMSAFPDLPQTAPYVMPYFVTDNSNLYDPNTTFKTIQPDSVPGVYSDCVVPIL